MCVFAHLARSIFARGVTFRTTGELDSCFSGLLEEGYDLLAWKRYTMGHIRGHGCRDFAVGQNAFQRAMA